MRVLFFTLKASNSVIMLLMSIQINIFSFIVDFDVEKMEDFGVTLGESINFDYLRR